MPTPSLSRRSALGLLCAGAAAAASPLRSARPAPFVPAATPALPQGKFLWGAATAGHQVEGNLVNDDDWALEHLPDSMFHEPSGDACDQYHRYAEDIALLADLGLNAYRFSVEWSRIEPAKGLFSQSELGHYRRMLEACHQHGVTPVVTYNHNSVPLWFANQGAWENPEAPALFARYCTQVSKSLGDLITYAITLNEPNLPLLFRWLEIAPGMTISLLNQQKLVQVRKQLGQPNFNTYLLGDPDKMLPLMLASHSEGRKAIKAERPNLPVGFSLAIEDDQAPPASMNTASGAEAKRREAYAPWFAMAKSDDFIGVQTYTRAFVGKTNLRPPAGTEITLAMQEFYPESLEHTIRLTARETGVPILVTESGCAVTDDTRRVEYIRRSVAGVERCRQDGIDVRSYIHWSLLDNFEWVSGFGPTFGLVAVDFATQKRTVKPSATYLGHLAATSKL